MKANYWQNRLHIHNNIRTVEFDLAEIDVTERDVDSAPRFSDNFYDLFCCQMIIETRLSENLTGIKLTQIRLDSSAFRS